MAAPNLRPSAISVINGVKSALVNASRRKPRSLPSHQRPELSIEENLFLRHRHLAPALKAHYTGSEGGPLKLINGRGQYLYDSNHDQYLDLVNNVCHVGHCHPRVVTAASVQLGRLNTNSRYLHDNIVRLSQELTATMPDQLTTCFFVNSGSEANDLALRLARNHTSRQRVACVDGAYHGNSTATLEISPYSRYAAVEKPKDIIKLMQPDAYRMGLPEHEVTARCADEFERHLQAAHLSNDLPAAYIIESVMCCGGQVFLPDGYLKSMYKLARSCGAVTIADEVQTGFGRLGHSYWAFESHGVVPDIVTVGKPFGNGMPLAAVVTTSAIAETSADCEYFNTFGGNPVSTAVGLEVLSIIADEELQANAARVGAHAMRKLSSLAKEYESVGDVRGEGLMIGIELVKDRETREPDPEAAQKVMHRLRSDGVLVSTDGPHASVIKMKPPMVINSEDMNHVVESLEAALDHHKRSDHRIRTWMRSEHQVAPPAATSRQSALGRSSLLDSVLGRGGDGAQRAPPCTNSSKPPQPPPTTSSKPSQPVMRRSSLLDAALGREEKGAPGHAVPSAATPSSTLQPPAMPHSSLLDAALGRVHAGGTLRATSPASQKPAMRHSTLLDAALGRSRD